MARVKYSVDVRIEKTVEIEFEDDGKIDIGDQIHDEAATWCGGYNRLEDDFEVMSYKAL